MYEKEGCVWQTLRLSRWVVPDQITREVLSDTIDRYFELLFETTRVKMHWYSSNSLILLGKKIDSTVNRPILCVLVTLMNIIWTTSQHGGCQAQPISHIVGGDRKGWRSRRVGWIISPCVYSIDSNINNTCFHIHTCSLKYLIIFIS